MTSLVLNNWALVFYISFNAIFKSYQDNERVIIKGFVHNNDDDMVFYISFNTI